MPLIGAWRFRKAGTADEWQLTTIPGTIHTDLYNSGVIPDPFLGCNSMNLGWVDEADWEYTIKFRVDEFFFKNKHVDLVFEGLDTYAEVYLNDSLILNADNMFRKWVIRCDKLLNDGENSIRILFRSALSETRKKSKELPYTLPGGEWAYVRKAAYHFGWDWGPRFVTCGIWKPIYLQSWSDFNIENIQVYTDSIYKGDAYLTAKISVPSGRFQHIEVNVSDGKRVFASVKSKVGSGKNVITVPFRIKKPKIWWSNGLGESYLYNFSFIVEGENAQRTKSINYGIRTIELVQESDSVGKSFYFKLNGVPVFMKGANFIPRQSFLPSASKENFEQLLVDAANSGFNMLRLWGGGAYEEDRFYDLCDSLGILVWQDFMFACSMYPSDSVFLQNVREEATQQVLRLRNHPCIALWCGNNEIDEGWKNWGWKRQFDSVPAIADSIWDGYQKLFHQLLPSVVAKYDAKASYWSSSPQFGWGHNESMAYGDSHYWGVWWGKQPFGKYQEKVPRFMSEYGFQGAPSAHTIKCFSGNGGMPDSTEMRCHQKHPVGYETIDTFMQREGFQPNGIDDWTYYSQITQAIGYRVAIESHRLASPRCMGTLYWQLNDCWPVVSWSSIDYLGHWKAVHYTVRDCYKSVLVSAQVNDSVIVVNAVSDSLQPVSGKITLTILSTLGDTLKQWTKEVLLKPNIAVSVARIENPVKKIDYNKYFIHTRLSLKDKSEFELVSFFGKVGELQVEDPLIVQEITKGDNGGTITLSSKYPAFFVELSSSNPDCRFENNYLHILPGRKYAIKYSGNLDDKLKLKFL
ncbi:beta-mannosidase [Tenuifilaceae bacterium CYCD]|nr:beta-mannosidase [Tenuifilaceae bacterium CYCD]